MLKHKAILGICTIMAKAFHKTMQRPLRWYRLAAEQGYAIAQYNLGVMYFNGEGSLRKDNSLAYMWFHLLLINGNELGGEPRNIAAEEMTPEDISKAQVMARECMSNDYKNCGY